MFKLPSIVSKLPNDVRIFLDRVREALSEAPTVEALKQAGVITTNKSGAIVGIQYYPITPTGLTATGAMTSIMLEWDAPNYKGHAYAEVWRSNTNNIGQATLIGQATGTMFADAVGSAASRYYWIRFVSQANDIGAFNGVSGVFGETAPDPAYLLDQLEGELTDFQLDQDLRSRINLIDDKDLLNAPDLVGGLISAIRRVEARSSESIRSVDNVYERVTQLLLKAKDHDDTFRTAGIVVDPETGQVSISGVDQLRKDFGSYRSDVAITIDAVKSDINLKASTSYVNQKITEAALDPQSLGQLEDVYARLDSAEVDINGVQGSVALKANQVIVDGINDRVSTAEGEIDVLQGEIALKATSAALGSIDTRVQTAEQTLSTIDGASITQSATAVRFLERDVDSESRLSDLMKTHSATSGVMVALADAKNEVTARVVDVASGLQAEVVARQSLAAQVGGSIVDVRNELSVRANNDEALAQSIEALAAEMAAGNAITSALVIGEESARVTAIDAVTQTVATLQSTFDDNSAATTAQIQEERITRASETTALSETLDLLTATVSDNATTSAAAVSTEQQARVNAVSAVSETVNHNQAVMASDDTTNAEGRLAALVRSANLYTDASVAIADVKNEVTARVSEVASGLQAETVARETLVAHVANSLTSVTNELSVLSSKDEALAQSITTLAATVANGDAANTALIQTEATARANALGALAETVETLQATFDSDKAETTALIQEEKLTRVEESATLAQATTTLKAGITGVGVIAFQDNAYVKGSVVTGLEAQKTVKIDNNGYVTGYGLASSVVDGVPQSEFAIVADRFSIAPVSTDNTLADGSPFFYRTVATTINGVNVPAGAYMKAAFIHDAAITNAKIANLAVDSAKIADASIVNAKISDAAISTAKIQAAAISTAHIQNAAITSALILDGAIVNAKIADATITNAKISTLEADRIVASKIDTRGLSIKDANGNVILAAGTALTSSYITPSANWLNNVDGRVSAPGGGVFVSGSGTVSGALKIRLPVGYTNTMLKFTVDIYEYSTGYSCTMSIGGYNYPVGPQWYNCSASVIGGNVEYPVYFGHDADGYCAVWIGTNSESWSYPQVTVRDVLLGYANYTAEMWSDGWVISFGPVYSYNAYIGDTYPPANWAKVSGAGKPQDNATVGATFGTNIYGKIEVGQASTYIADAAIGSAQIGSLNADVINAGTISAARIDVDNLTVKNINATSSASGARMTMTNSTITVYDANNVVRVKIGLL